MKVYVIRINTVDNLYVDYIVEASNLFSARSKAINTFLVDYPDADMTFTTSLQNINKRTIKEIIKYLKEKIGVNNN